MLTIVKRGQPWSGEASGHVLRDEFAREFKRGGATVVALSQEQWDGFFGRGKTEGVMDGLQAILDPELPDDTLLFYDSSHRLIGSLSNLYTIPKKKA